MPGKSKIEWTDAIWNPVTGCTKVSAGCLNCYAEMMTRRFQWDGPFVPWTVRAQRDSGTPAVYLHHDRMDIPSRWQRGRRVFVNSMSDLFHPDVPDQFIAFVFQQMSRTPRHTFQVLTKRPERALEWFNKVEVFKPDWPHVVWLDYGVGITDTPWPLPNVWMGVSVESSKNLSRLDLLAQIPAAVRFVSVEPLLGPLDLRPWLTGSDERTGSADDGSMLDWVILGCESGSGARPMDEAWVRGMLDQCQFAEVPFFYKQAVIDGKLVALPELGGRQWKEFPA